MYAISYERMVEPATTKLIRNATKFVQYWFWKEGSVEENGTDSEGEPEAVMRMPRTAASL